MALRINFGGVTIHKPGYYGDPRDLDPTNTRIVTPPLPYETREAIVDFMNVMRNHLPMFAFLTFNPAAGFHHKAGVMNPEVLDTLEELKVVYKLMPGVLQRGPE